MTARARVAMDIQADGAGEAVKELGIWHIGPASIFTQKLVDATGISKCTPIVHNNISTTSTGDSSGRHPSEVGSSDSHSVTTESTQTSQVHSGKAPESVESIRISSILSSKYHELQNPIPDIDGASDMIVRGFMNGAKVCQFVSRKLSAPALSGEFDVNRSRLQKRLAEIRTLTAVGWKYLDQPIATLLPTTSNSTSNNEPSQAAGPNYKQPEGPPREESPDATQFPNGQMPPVINLPIRPPPNGAAPGGLSSGGDGNQAGRGAGGNNEAGADQAGSNPGGNGNAAGGRGGLIPGNRGGRGGQSGNRTPTRRGPPSPHTPTHDDAPRPQPASPISSNGEYPGNPPNTPVTPQRRVVNEFFEIAPSILGGLGAFARKDIAEGEHVLLERPLIQTTCMHLDREFSKLDANRQAALLSLSGYHPNPEATPIEKIWNVNAFRTGATDSIFQIAARFNHACPSKANVKYRFDHRRGIIVLTVVRAVPKGAELLVSYGKNPEALYERFGFRCTCGCPGFSERDAEKLHSSNWSR